MDNRQQRTLRAFHNILIYCEQHPVKPEPPLLTGMRKSLQASITRIERLRSDQSDATRAMNGGVANAALNMADAIAPHTKLLASAGYSNDFLRELRVEAKALALVARNTDKARTSRTSATAAIAAEFKKAMRTVTVLEGLVMLHKGSDLIHLRHWKNRRRVSARIGRPKRRGRGSQSSVIS